jgi:hypothetical protein
MLSHSLLMLLAPPRTYMSVTVGDPRFTVSHPSIQAAAPIPWLQRRHPWASLNLVAKNENMTDPDPLSLRAREGHSHAMCCVLPAARSVPLTSRAGKDGSGTSYPS